LKESNVNARRAIGTIGILSCVSLALACGGGAGSNGAGGNDGGAGGTASETGGMGGGGAGMGGNDEGGAGGSVPMLCSPGASQACYEGPSDTENVGVCIGGVQICNAKGDAWGRCDGQVLPSLEDCSVLGDEDCDGSACSETRWSMALTGTADLSVIDTAIDALGNIYLVAEFGNGTVSYATESYINTAAPDLLLVKLDPLGVPFWTRRLAPAGNAFDPRIAVTPDGGVVAAGTFNGIVHFDGTSVVAASSGQDMFVGKLDANGNHVWSRFLTNHDNPAIPSVGPLGDKVIHDLSVDMSGNVYLGGHYTGHWGGLCLNGCPASAIGHGAWLRALNASGSNQWSKTWDGTGNQAVTALSAASVAGLGVGLSFSSNLDLGGGTTYTATSGTDAAFARYDLDGNFVSSQQLGGSLAQLVTGVHATSSSFFVTGVYNGGNPFGAPNSTGAAMYLAELDHDGNAQWVDAYMNTSTAFTEARVTQGPFGNVVVTASLNGSVVVNGQSLQGGVSGKWAGVVIKHDALGTPLWARSLPVPNEVTRILDVAIALDGDIVAVGAYTEAVDMGDQVLPFGGASDGFVVRMQP
jgi:hypothetical protein